MPKYFYTALSRQGEKISGTETAESEQELSHALGEKGYILTTAKTEQKKKGLLSFEISLNVLTRVSTTDKLLLTRNLQVMVAAGIPLPRSLDVLSKQAKNARLEKALVAIKGKVMEGSTFSEALEGHKDIFSELFLSMIKVGEESGTLEKVLVQLTLQLEREHDLKSKVTGALMYPAVIITAMIGIGSLMLVLVVPKLAATFEELGVELPLTTRFIIALGTFTAERWYIVFPAMVGSLVSLYLLSRTKPGKRIVDALVLRLPILSGIIRKSIAALMTRTLSSLIGAGVPIVRALEITSEVVGNVYFRESLAEAAEKVAKGEKLSAVLQEYKGLYPVMIVQMIEVGEETGETGTILAKLADFFEEEVTQVTKNLTSIIEPILMLMIGGMVGFFAISMIQPMYSLLGEIQ